MKKRIYFNFIGLILIFTLLLSVISSLIFWNATKARETAAVKENARMTADFLNLGFTGELFDYISGGNVLRMTVIKPDGTVILDNKTVAGTLENHGDRVEVISALKNGSGEAMRFSETLTTDSYYYAIRLNDGNVLRISKSMDGIFGVFMNILPAIAAAAVIVIVLAPFLARRLTLNIIRPLDGIDFESDNIAVYDELIPFARKIDSQKREISAQLKALQNRVDTIETITKNMKEGLILIDGSGTALSANGSASEIFGGDIITGKDILHVCRDIPFQKGVKDCLSGKNAEMTYERGGKIYSVYFSPVQSGEGAGGGIILLFDITEKHAAEKQRREFSANVSHELKTPLTAISALAEMITGGMAKESDIKAFSKKILEQTNRLINIIDDIIKLSEFDEGRAASEFSEFDLYALAGTVIESLREKADEKRVFVRVTGERLRIKANRRMIDELLYNLIDNAVKYNKENGAVTVAISEEDGFCVISVTDTGVGIPPEHQTRAFERFYRVDKSRSKKTGGTGLGLSIVKHIAEFHGGSASLESEEGMGTTVICRLKCV